MKILEATQKDSLIVIKMATKYGKTKMKTN